KAFVAAFDAFLAGSDRSDDDKRWLYAYRVDRAPEGERVPILLAWAADEERIMGDPKAAADLYGRVLAIEPRHEGALDARARLLLDIGDAAGAVSLIGRAMAEPDTRARAAGLLQKACDEVQDLEVRSKILDMLLSTPADAPELRSFRRGWFERLLAPLSDNPHRALEVALRVVAERPQEAALWDRVEQLGRETEQPELVADAY